MRLDNSSAPDRRQPDPKPTFGQRIRAWWEGYDASEGAAAVRFVPSNGSAYLTPDKNLRLPLIAECLNQVWGVGFTGPGDAAHCCDLVRVLALNEKQSLLVLGAGLGGPARAIAKEYGVWIHGLESDPVLAEAGMILSNDLGMGRKAPVSLADPAALDLPANKYQCVFSKEFLHRVVDRESLATQVAEATKAGGHLLISTFTIGEDATDTSALDAWLAAESTPPTLLTASAEEAIWRESGFTIRVVEDISDPIEQNVKRVFAGWREIVGRIASYRDKRAMLEELVGIVKLWTLRLAALQSGALRIHRIHATRGTED